ncbi:MAG: hypothetical protein ACHQ53_12965 [Polyangiales bacterium]
MKVLEARARFVQPSITRARHESRQPMQVMNAPPRRLLSLVLPGTLCLLLWPAAVGRAQSVLVVEVSSLDDAPAERLLELIERPVQRVSMPQAREPTAALGLARALQVDRIAILDSEMHRVHVVRTRDGTVMTRVVQASEVSQAPYVTAFVASELLALSAQLDTPERAREGLLARRLSLTVGGELIGVGVPYGGGLRPELGAALWLAPAGTRFAWVLELLLGLTTDARVAAAMGRLELSRTDVSLRTGVACAIGRVALLGLARARLAWTDAAYLGPAGVPATRVGWGPGVDAEAQLELTRWLVAYAGVGLTLEASRSEYRVQSVRVATDPAALLAARAGLQLALRVR